MAHAGNPSTLGGRSGRIARSRDGNQPGQHGETPFLLEIQKLAKRGGTCLYSQLFWRLRQENHFNLGGRGCSELRSCHCTPTGQQSETLLQKKKKIFKNRSSGTLSSYAIHAGSREQMVKVSKIMQARFETQP